ILSVTSCASAAPEASAAVRAMASLPILMVFPPGRTAQTTRVSFDAPSDVGGDLDGLDARRVVGMAARAHAHRASLAELHLAAADHVAHHEALAAPLGDRRVDRDALAVG